MPAKRVRRLAMLFVVIVALTAGVFISARVFAMSHPKLLYYGHELTQADVARFADQGRPLHCTPIYTETAFQFVGIYTDVVECFDTNAEAVERAESQKASRERWDTLLYERYPEQISSAQTEPR